MDDSQFARLQNALDAIENDVAAMRIALREVRRNAAAAAAAAPSPPPQEPAVAAPQPPLQSQPEPVPQPTVTDVAPPRKRRDLESMIGEQWFLYVGALLVVIGVASFLKIAFDRNWIGPVVRVALGIVGGAAIMGAAELRRKRVAPFFADTLVGLGAAIEYVTFFSANTLFHVMGVTEVFIGMIAVTATVGAIAYRGGRQSLAYVGLAGGYLTPLLVGSSTPDTLTLFIYLGVLSAFAVTLSELRRWRAVAIVSLVMTIVYWESFGYDTSVAHPIAVRLLLALGLYAVFAATSVLAWRRKQSIDALGLIILALNAVWFLAGICIIAAGSKAYLAGALLLVTAAHLWLARLTQQREQLWLAVVALTFAIPPLAYSFPNVSSDVADTAMHLAWVLLAAGASFAAIRSRDVVLSVIAMLAGAASVLHVALLAAVEPRSTTLFINDRFLTLAATAIAAWFVSREAERAGAISAALRDTVRIGVDVIALIAISPEAWHAGELLAPKMGGQAGTVGISIAWTMYGAALVILGFRSSRASRRWVGLGLLGLTVFKVFLYDLVGLDIVFRVLSALILGIVLIVMAFIYQRRIRAAKSTQQ